jgi:hypothetical protein
MSIEYPTCGESFKLVAPYDIDLLAEFNGKLGALQTSAQGQLDKCDACAGESIGECVNCIEDNNFQEARAFIGCVTCAQVNSRLDPTGANDISKYFSDSVYQKSVDAAWGKMTQQEQAYAIKNSCINVKVFTMPDIDPSIPATPISPSNPIIVTPESNSDMSAAVIAGIVLGVMGGLLFLVVFYIKMRKPNADIRPPQIRFVPIGFD